MLGHADDAALAQVNPQAAEGAGVLIAGLLRGVVMQYLFDREALVITRLVPQVQLAALGSLR